MGTKKVGGHWTNHRRVPVYKSLSDVEDHLNKTWSGQQHTSGFVSLEFDKEGAITNRFFHILGHTEEPTTFDAEVIFGRGLLPAGHQVRIHLSQTTFDCLASLRLKVKPNVIYVCPVSPP